MYVYNSDKGISVVYDESTLSVEDKARGMYFESLPFKEIIEGKIGILKLNTSNNSLYYEYIDIPVYTPTKPTKPQPTNQDIQDNIMILMMAINDIYALLPEPTPPE